MHHAPTRAGRKRTDACRPETLDLSRLDVRRPTSGRAAAQVVDDAIDGRPARIGRRSSTADPTNPDPQVRRRERRPPHV
jgi:hypothetical protein